MYSKSQKPNLFQLFEYMFYNKGKTEELPKNHF